MDNLTTYLTIETPHFVLLASMLMLCVAIVTILFLKRDVAEIRRGVLVALFLEYLFFVLSETIFFRDVMATRECHLELFWNYRLIREDPAAANGIWEIILNILLFVPFGLLIGAFGFRKGKAIIIAVLSGFLFSSFIEGSQYYFHKGVCETDDVLHNSVGCLLGLVIFWLLIRGIKTIKK